MMKYELGILGAGNMAEAIVRGVLNAKRLTPQQIVAADVSPERRKFFQDELGVTAVDDNAQVAGRSRMVLLSVKPQMMQAALDGIGKVMSADSLIISIAAGISSKFIESALGGRAAWHVVRSMPNTPMLVGQGMVGIAAGRHATADDLAAARRLFESAADVIEVNESQIDAVTAISGSGPAYFFFLVEQMIAAGIQLGLSAEQSRKLAAKTALGAATMLTTSPDSPTELRRKVTSPGGTTAAAIISMESHGLPQIVIEAIKAAEKRGKELGR
jgi:pyrroline-5-carboxylate reductase